MVISGCRLLAVTVVSTLLILLLSATAEAQTYTLVDIGVDPQNWSPASEGTGLNALGQVVGFNYAASSTNCTAGNPCYQQQPFVYSNGVRTDLNYHGKYFNGLNNFGRVAGGGPGDLPTANGGCPFLYSIASGTFVQLAQPQCNVNNNFTQAYAVNDSGRVAWLRHTCIGFNCVGHPSEELHIGDATSNDLIPSTTTPGTPVGINRLGHVAGNAYFVANGTLTPISTETLPDNSTKSFMVTGMNDLDQLVGWQKISLFAGTEWPVIWSANGARQVIEYAGVTSRLVALNNVGQAVGVHADLDTGYLPSPFLYENGTRTTLASITALPQGWTLTNVKAINDSKWILATAKPCDVCGPHAVLLVPTATAAPTVALSPVDQSVSLSTASPSAQFQSVANGNPTPAYQWQQSTDNGQTWTNIPAGAPWSGVTTNLLTVAPADTSLNNVLVRCVATNTVGSAATASARLTVTATTVSLTMTMQPASQNTVPGGTVTLSGAATGSGPISYRWSRNGTPIPGEVAPTLVIPNARTSDAGAYTLAVTNSAGTITSTTATVTVVSMSVTSLQFAATKAGAAGDLIDVTSPQPVTVSFAGGSPSWTLVSDQPFVTVTPASGTGNGLFTVSIVNPNNVLAGATSANATLTLTGSNPSLTLTWPVSLKVKFTETAAPFGFFDTPQGSASLTGAVSVTGWALDDVGVQRVQIWRNCVDAIDRPLGACVAAVPGGAPDFVYIADAAFLPGARPDVEAVYPISPQVYRAGWGYLLATNALPHVPAPSAPSGGQGTFTLSGYAVDAEAHYTLLGTKTIKLDNDGATNPFGTLDTPVQGGLVTTSVSASFGWAMASAGKCIATSSPLAYKVYIDGVSRTLTPGVNWFSGLFRSDIAAAYPGRCNTNDALAAYYIDANALGLANGLHTTGWDVFDTTGSVTGIGSRFFNLLIGSGGSGGVVGSGFSRITEADSTEIRLKPDPTNDADRPIALADANALAALAPERGPLKIQRGGDEAPAETIAPSSSGEYAVQFPSGGRLAIDLGGPVTAGFQVVGDELRALPGGSTLLADDGFFAWQPAVPFLGPFHLVFVRDNMRIDVKARIVDAAADLPLEMYIDSPSPDSSIGGSFIVAGWALDPLAASGSGIDTLHVWAIRRDGVAAPQFLGAASVGGLRPDLAAIKGDQFERSGFTLTTPNLAPGVYDILVYPWSRRAGGFQPAQSVRVAVR